MAETDTLLGMRPFAHPAYDRFVAAFTDLVAALPLSAGPDVAARLTEMDGASIIKAVEAAVRAVLGRPLGQDQLSDAIFAFGHFVHSHRRLPQVRYQVNDVLYHIRTSDEILDPLRVYVSDKEYAKLHVTAAIGADYVVPTLEILRRPRDIDALTLTQRSYLKPTHSSTRVMVAGKGDDIDRERLHGWLTHNYYSISREANYRHLEPKIIVEPDVFEGGDELECKVYCVEGEPRIFKFITDRTTRYARVFVDPDWTVLPIDMRNVKPRARLEKPGNFDEISWVAREVSQGFSMVRVDLYLRGDRIYVGELTNCEGGATYPYYPEDGEQIASRVLFGARADALG